MRSIRKSFLFIPAVAALVVASLSACAPATTGTGGSTPAPGSSTSPSGGTSGSGSSSGSSGSSGGSSAAEINACSLVSASSASSTMGASYISATNSTIATGQDQCAYATSDDSQALVVIVYQPNSGVSFAMLKSVQAGVGSVTTVSGVGDKAILGSIELDVQAGSHLIAIEGGLVSQNPSGAEALAKQLISALG